MKILLGMDDSPHAQAALDFVIGMSWPPKTRVIVVSAAHLEAAVYSEVYAGAAMPTANLWDEELKNRQEQAARAEDRLRRAGLMSEARASRRPTRGPVGSRSRRAAGPAGRGIARTLRIE